MRKTPMPPIDLRAPGAIDQLLAFHRATFGTARMDANGGDGGQGAGDGGQAGAGDANAGAGTGDQSGTDNGSQSGQQTSAEKVEDLPEWAQKIIRDTRAEAASNRTKATAAEQTHTQTLDAIAKALGLKTDDAAPDPAKLTEQLTSAQQAQRQAAVELAVYKTASKHSGDPDALLDSRAFLAKVAELDPTAGDFAAKVDEAIKSAIADNPKLKATQAAGSSSVDHAGGSGEDRKPIKPTSLDSAVSAHYGTR